MAVKKFFTCINLKCGLFLREVKVGKECCCAVMDTQYLILSNVKIKSNIRSCIYLCLFGRPMQPQT